MRNTHLSSRSALVKADDDVAAAVVFERLTSERLRLDLLVRATVPLMCLVGYRFVDVLCVAKGKAPTEGVERR